MNWWSYIEAPVQQRPRKIDGEEKDAEKLVPQSQNTEMRDADATSFPSPMSLRSEPTQPSARSILDFTRSETKF